ncbi:hypothetical protein J2847_000944 [Azospirillum agricola]|uniref:EndoU domain-containing protein n=1 Tax=Azospirillum agricola TaxID=1720247 RepID=UPI002D807E47|nr:EndoU domain-containing protein [Azospirillum agricola]MBP2227662.1 hypothetical protein [Azospirillum agricola]
MRDGAATPLPKEIASFFRGIPLTPALGHHIQHAEVRGEGNRLVGFHHAPNGVMPSGITTVSREAPDRNGVYRIVYTHASAPGAGSKGTTMFPDRMSHQEIMNAVRHALDNPTHWNGTSYFEGPSGHGFTIGGHIRDGVIGTAFPISETPFKT